MSSMSFDNASHKLAHGFLEVAVTDLASRIAGAPDSRGCSSHFFYPADRGISFGGAEASRSSRFSEEASHFLACGIVTGTVGHRSRLRTRGQVDCDFLLGARSGRAHFCASALHFAAQLQRSRLSFVRSFFVTCGGLGRAGSTHYRFLDRCQYCF